MRACAARGFDSFKLQLIKTQQTVVNLFYTSAGDNGMSVNITHRINKRYRSPSMQINGGNLYSEENASRYAESMMTLFISLLFVNFTYYVSEII